MIGVALSDIHLGYRAYPATIDGRNAREVDVEVAWHHAVDRIVQVRPDVVLVAGDILHHPRVSGHAIKAWRDGVRRIVEGTDAHVVAVLGNHDVARTREILAPALIPDDLPRVRIVTEPRRLYLNLPRTGERVAVSAFPFVALGSGEVYALEPDPDADVNILLIHAAVRTSAEGAARLPVFYAGETALDVGREAERWDVVAAGDYHEFHRLHPDRLAFYSGSIERTSSNIWPETAAKGVVRFDTDTDELELLEIPTREMADYDLGDFDHPPGATAETVNDALRRMAEYDRLRGAIVRLKAEHFPRADRDAIDWKLVRQLKTTCLHFQLDLHFADREVADLGDRRERAVRSLADDAAAFFADDPEPVRACAYGYLGLEVGP